MKGNINNIVIMLMFMFGFVFIRHSKGYKENFEQESNNHTNEVSESKKLFDLFKTSSQCPTKIIHNNDGIYLYFNSTSGEPKSVKLNNLEQFVKLLEQLRKNNVNCPILFYKEMYSTQNNIGYRYMPEYSTLMLPTPEQSRLSDANRSSHKIYNKNTYPGYDPYNQYIGLNTPLDKMFHEKETISDNPMDAVWGGKDFTETAIQIGKYKGNEVILEVA